MSILIYSLCTIVSCSIAWILWRHHRVTRSRLLYWSAICFVGLTVNNLLLVCDEVLFPVQYDLSTLRQLAALASLSVLLFGLIYEDE